MVARRRAGSSHARLDRTVRIGAGVRQRAGVVAGAAGASAADLVLVGASYALQGDGDAWLAGLAALAVSVAASLLGDLVWYLAGRRFGNRTLQSLCRLSLSRDSCMKQTERFFALGRARAGGRQVRAGLVDGFGADGRSNAGTPCGVPAIRRLRCIVVGIGRPGRGCCVRASGAGRARLAVELGSGAIVVLAALLAGYVGWRWWRRQSLLRSLEHARIAVEELVPLLDGEESLRPTVLDIRAPGYRQLQPYTIPGAVFADERQLAQILASVPRDRSVVIYCACPDEVSAAWLAARMRERGSTAMCGHCWAVWMHGAMPGIR